MVEKKLKYTAEQIDSAIEKVKNMPSEGVIGPKGEQGATGPAGKDGKEIELQKTSTYIQWRYVGGSWNNLVALADLKGDKGDGANVDLTDYALKSWVTEQIARVQAGGSVDLSSYYNKTEIDTKLSSKADSTTVTSHTSDTTSHITSAERISWNSKSTLALGTSSSTAFRGDYGNVAYTHSQSAHAPYNAEANVQADWNVSDTSSDAYIKNKPVIPVAYDDSEIRSSLDNLESEINELKEGNINIDLTEYAKKSELHSHSNKSVLDNITTNKVNQWDNKSNFSGSYNDLTNKPTSFKPSSHIHSINEISDYPNDLATKDYVDDAINNAKLEGGDVQVDLSAYAKKSDLHDHSNKTILDSITTSKVNQWDNKSDFSGNYNDLKNKPTIPTKVSELTNDKGYLTEYQDVSWDAIIGKPTTFEPSSHNHSINDISDYPNDLATKDYVEKAIDNAKLEGGDVQVDLSAYAKKSDLHDHSNKTILDSITTSKVNQWDNKSDFSGNYNDLTNKPTIPTKVSDLQNDSGYLTEHQDISGKVDKVDGKSLISDDEIERLSTLKNYDDTDIKNSLNSKANKTELHSHSNKSVLDGITSSKITEWNNKSTFDGNYNSLTNKPASLPANGGNANTVGGYSLWVGTQSQYDAIATKSNTTIYMIKEG